MNHSYLIMLLLVAKRILHKTRCISIMQAYSSYLFLLFKAGSSSIRHQICFEIPKKENGDGETMRGPLYARTYRPTQVRLWLPNPKISGFNSFIFLFGEIWMRLFCSANIIFTDQNQGTALASCCVIQTKQIGFFSIMRRNSLQWIGLDWAPNGKTNT